MKTFDPRMLVLAVIVLLFPAVLMPANGATAMNKPQPKVIPLKTSGNDVTPILSGPPETVTMKSGYVVLGPGKSVGKHSTEDHEEILIVLQGEGEMRFADGSKLAVKANTALYCPPQTEHNVTNIGTTRLRYVYVVARAR
jgi:mannose-6-phosphate isomerase-like protein (cupin superfamily)